MPSLSQIWVVKLPPPSAAPRKFALSRKKKCPPENPLYQWVWNKEGKVADRCGERPSPREARPPPHVRHAQHPSYCRALARAIAHDPQAQSRPTEHTHPPKIPQKDRGYARYSRCGHAEVRQFTYLLTYLLRAFYTLSRLPRAKAKCAT